MAQENDSLRVRKAGCQHRGSVIRIERTLADLLGGLTGRGPKTGYMERGRGSLPAAVAETDGRSVPAVGSLQGAVL
jgi:hypothetical protein